MNKRESRRRAGKRSVKSCPQPRKDNQSGKSPQPQQVKSSPSLKKMSPNQNSFWLFSEIVGKEIVKFTTFSHIYYCENLTILSVVGVFQLVNLSAAFFRNNY